MLQEDDSMSAIANPRSFDVQISHQNDLIRLKAAIIDLYLNVKVRSAQEVMKNFTLYKFSWKTLTNKYLLKSEPIYRIPV